MFILFVLNGKNVIFDVDFNMFLFWVIWESVGLYGIKFGCGMVQCGVCIVQLDGIVVCFCVLLVFVVVGKCVIIIEGIQSKFGKVVQDVWVKFQVLQCGYCQFGQIMFVIVLLEQNVSFSDVDIDVVMNGNICCCVVYVWICVVIYEVVDILKV